MFRYYKLMGPLDKAPEGTRAVRYEEPVKLDWVPRKCWGFVDSDEKLSDSVQLECDLFALPDIFAAGTAGGEGPYLDDDLEAIRIGDLVSYIYETEQYGVMTVTGFEGGLVVTAEFGGFAARDLCIGRSK